MSDLSPSDLDRWQPFSSAPKDGNTFLVYLSDEGFPTICRWDDREALWWLPAFDLWQDDDCIHHLTHWMPLPAPPVVEDVRPQPESDGLEPTPNEVEFMQQMCERFEDGIIPSLLDAAPTLLALVRKHVEAELAASVRRPKLESDGLAADKTERCTRCDVLEDLLETARIQVEHARQEAEKADDEAIEHKAENLRLRAQGSRQDYALIKRFQRRAETAEAELAARNLTIGRRVEMSEEEFEEYFDTLLHSDQSSPFNALRRGYELAGGIIKEKGE